MGRVVVLGELVLRQEECKCCGQCFWTSSDSMEIIVRV